MIKNKLLALVKLVVLNFRMRPAALLRAQRKADQLHKKTGCRYRVFFILGKYRVMDRNDIRDRKKSGIFKFWLKAGKDFDTIAFYDTNSTLGNDR
jgi:hypothetical protein